MKAGDDEVDEPHPQVVAAARRGDIEAFEVLVRTYQPDVWRLCLSLLGEPAAADDAAQEAFVRAFRFLPRYRGESRFSTWLFTIARNCALDEVRRSARHKRLAEAAESRPAPVAARRELWVEVRDALIALPLELREPVVLIDVLGRTYAEAAQALSAPVGTIKSRVHRARELLADALAEQPRRSLNRQRSRSAP